MRRLLKNRPLCLKLFFAVLIIAFVMNNDFKRQHEEPPQKITPVVEKTAPSMIDRPSFSGRPSIEARYAALRDQHAKNSDQKTKGKRNE